MKKRSRKRQMNLGGSPLEHTRKLRKAIQHLNANVEAAERFAKQGKCAVAQESYEEAHRWLGMEQAHVESVGKHRHLLEMKVNLTAPRRKMVAARKALETYCGREK